MPDNLAELGRLTLLPDTNIIKLPNISASVPQLVAAIKELQGKGYKMPDFPENPKTDEEKEHPRALRQVPRQRGESGAARRQLGPPRTAGGEGIRAQAPARMGEWSQASRTHVAHMQARRLLSRREVDDAGPARAT